jgi:hypothetical protein
LPAIAQVEGLERIKQIVLHKIVPGATGPCREKGGRKAFRPR